MILYINTTQGDDIIITIKKGSRTVVSKKINAKYSQAEKLLPLIDKLSKEKKMNTTDIRKIKVANTGGSFTALRIGVVTANALGFALGIPVESIKKGKKSNKEFDIIKPMYYKKPNIT